MTILKQSPARQQLATDLWTCRGYRRWRGGGRILLILLGVVLMAKLNGLFDLPRSPSQYPGKIDALWYNMANIESDGFFTDIGESDWKRLKDRSALAQQQRFASPKIANGEVTDPARFYQNSYEPEFTCLGERRVGGLGDGPKWVCDPHRIGTQGTTQDASACLIYSVGSAGKVEFERGVRDEIASGKCEVHVFDMSGYNKRNGNFTELSAAVGATFHKWGIESEAKARKRTEAGGIKKSNLKTLAETVALLNHKGRDIDIFKIDCEGCEWDTYEDWFTSGVTMRQILVEVHRVKIPETFDFFKRLTKENYQIFHKEANVIANPCAEAWEYAFIRLSSSFVNVTRGILVE